MTREKAKENIAKILNSVSHIHNDLILNIDNVYDDFESRTCENCGYYSKGYCRRDALIMFGKDFGCNKFIRKPDED